MNRRQLIRYTLGAGGLTLAGLTGLALFHVDGSLDDEGHIYRHLSGRDRYLLFIIASFFLAPYLLDKTEASRVLWQVIRDVDSALMRVPPSTQDELSLLLGLLNNGVARLYFLKSHHLWSEADEGILKNCFDSMRFSNTAILRSAYQAIHQLVYGAFFSRETAWKDIGYR